MPARDGVLHLAFGERYCEEARHSIRALRVSNPALAVAVVTDRPWSGPQGELPDHFIRRTLQPGFRCKSAYIYEATPFERTLYLDTDARVVREVGAVFPLLEHYDIGVSFVGPWLGEDELHFHPQCSSSAILFQRNSRTEALFEEWSKRHRVASRGAQTGDPRGIGDQRYLALALARSEARPVHLDGALNFHFSDLVGAHRPPVIYGECRGVNADHGLFDRQLSQGWDPSRDWKQRVWWPQSRSFLKQYSRRELLANPLLLLAILLLRLDSSLARLRLRLLA